MNEVVDIYCKEFTTQVFTLVWSLVELGTVIEKLKSCLETYPYISQPCIILSLTVMLYITPYSAHYFSAVHFYLTSKMYVNLGETLYMF